MMKNVAEVETGKGSKVQESKVQSQPDRGAPAEGGEGLARTSETRTTDNDDRSAKAREVPTRAAELRYVAPGKVARSVSCPNPRKSFEAEGMAELLASVREQGVIQPLMVRPRVKPWVVLEPDLIEKGWRLKAVATGEVVTCKDEEQARYNVDAWDEAPGAEFELIAGERRWRCATEAKLKSVPVIVRELSDAEARKVQRLENLHRADLTPLEEGEDYKALVDGGLITVPDLMKETGKSRSYIYGRMALANLPAVVRVAYEAKQISFSVAEVVADVVGAAAQEEFLKEILEGGRSRYALRAGHGEDYEAKEKELDPMPFREVRRLYFENYLLDLAEAPFDVKDAKLVASAGACVKCPKRSGCNPELHPEIKSPDVCTDPGCFGTKKAALQVRRVEELREQGKKVIDAGVPVLDKWGHVDRSTHLSATDNIQTADGYVPIKEVLKKIPKAVRPQVLLAVPMAGEARECFDKKQVMAALEENGLLPKKETGDRKEDRAKEEAANKLEQDACAAAWGRVLGAVMKGKLKEQALFQILARILAENCPEQGFTLSELVKIDEEEEQLEIAAPALMGKDAAFNSAVIVDMLHSQDEYCGEVIAKACGLDLNKMEKEERERLTKAAESPAAEVTDAVETRTTEHDVHSAKGRVPTKAKKGTKAPASSKVKVHKKTKK